MRDNSQQPAAAANTLLGSANLRYLQVAALVPQQGEQKRLRRDGGGSLGGGVKKLQPTLPTKQHDDGTLMAIQATTPRGGRNALIDDDRQTSALRFPVCSVAAMELFCPPPQLA